jgi:hypothetical protein
MTMPSQMPAGEEKRPSAARVRLSMNRSNLNRQAGLYQVT